MSYAAELSLAIRDLAFQWYERFNRYAGDLYPGMYTESHCFDLAEQAMEIRGLAAVKPSMIVAHNYLLPEFHEIADKVGDSLGLAAHVRNAGARRVDFESVYFMGETAKIICGDATRVFVSDRPQVLGCSLVNGTDYDWVLRWKLRNPEGIVVTYVNCSAYAKSLSNYVSTSRNTDKIIIEAARRFPGRRILVMPDKFLGMVMKAKAVRAGVDENLIDVYMHDFDGNHACCYVHEAIGVDAAEEALADDPEAELLIHPECGCASVCLMKVDNGILPAERAWFLSTEGMLERARVSHAKRFIVATELGMVYRLRTMLPEKEFVPVSLAASCKFMKSNTFPKLLRSLREDRLEIVFCEDCCDPRHPFQDDRVVHIGRSVAAKAKVAIDRMLEIQ